MFQSLGRCSPFRRIDTKESVEEVEDLVDLRRLLDEEWSVEAEGRPVLKTPGSPPVGVHILHFFGAFFIRDVGPIVRKFDEVCCA